MPSAVVVIDVQQAFCEGEYKAFAVERVIDTINRVTTAARERSVPVVLVQHSAKSGPLAVGSRGWQFASALSVLSGDHVVQKTASDSFHQSDLEQVLNEVKAPDLIVCGIQSDFCVDSTVRRALALGFNVRLVDGGHTTLDNGVLTAAQISAHHAKTLTSIQSFQGKARVVSPETAFQ